MIRYSKNRSRSISQRGAVILLLALAASTVLLLLGTGRRLAVRQKVKEDVQRMNQRESYYSGEVTAWHSYTLTKAGLPFAPTASDGRSIASVETDFLAGLPAFTATPYAAATYKTGTPLNVKTTSPFDDGKSNIRRTEGNNSNVRYSAASGDFCGGMSFGNSPFYQTCLRETASGGSTLVPHAFAVGHPWTGYHIDGFFLNEYKYAVVASGGNCASGTYSAVRPKKNADGTFNPIDVSSLVPGDYKLCVIGISDKGVSQPVTEASGYAITVPPPISLPPEQGNICTGGMGTAQLKSNIHPSQANTVVACAPTHFSQASFDAVAGKKIVLGNSIDFNAVTNYVPINVTTLDFDGRGYRLKNIRSSRAASLTKSPYGGAVSQGSGVFATLAGVATIRNLVLENIQFTVPTNGTVLGSVLAALTAASLTVDNVHAINSGTAANSYGYLFAHHTAGPINIRNVSSVSNLPRIKGGVSGFTRTPNSTYTLDRALVMGDLAKSGMVGGLVDQMLAGTGSITNSGYIGAITNPSHAGGIIGRYAGLTPDGPFIIDNCFSKVTITAVTSDCPTGNTNTLTRHCSAGGLVGYVNNPIRLSNSSTLSTINMPDNAGVAGAIGMVLRNNQAEKSIISNVRVSTSVRATSVIGGLVATFDGVSGASASDSSRIENSLVMGSVTSVPGLNTNGNVAGGFAGTISGGYIQNSLALTTVSGPPANTGGFIGDLGYSLNSDKSNVTIQNSLSYGTVRGGSYVGGFVGTVENLGQTFTIRSSYSAGDVTSAPLSGTSNPASFRSGTFGGNIETGSFSNLFSLGRLIYPSGSDGGWFWTPKNTTLVLTPTQTSYYSNPSAGPGKCVPPTFQSPAACAKETDYTKFLTVSSRTFGFSSTEWAFPGNTLPYPKNL